VDSDVDEEFEFKNVETGKGNPFRGDKNVSNNHILKKKSIKKLSQFYHLQKIAQQGVELATFTFKV
jgi:hypothetical protein